MPTNDTTEAKQLPKLERVKTERERRLEVAANYARAELYSAALFFQNNSSPNDATNCQLAIVRIDQALNESGE